MNLDSVNLNHSVRVLYTHLKTTFISSNALSYFDFDGSIISSLGTGYLWANGCEMACIAISIAAFPLKKFCQYQVILFFHIPGICPSLLEARLVCQLLRVFSGRTGWSYYGLTTGGSSLRLGQASIVAHLPNSDLWLPFNSWWHKSMMRVFPWWVWYGTRFRLLIFPGFISSLGDCLVFAWVDQLVLIWSL